MDSQTRLQEINMFPKFWQATLLTLLQLITGIIFTVAAYTLLQKFLHIEPLPHSTVRLLCLVVGWLPPLIICFRKRALFLADKAVNLSAGIWSLSIFIMLIWVIFEFQFGALIHEVSPSSTSTIRIIQAVLIAPIFEEIFFRGFLLRAFLKNYNLISALILSSTLFTLVHVDTSFSLAHLESLLEKMVFSIIIGWIFYRTNSISLAIILHAISNLFISLVYLLMSSSNEIQNQFADLYFNSFSLAISLASIALFAIGLWLLTKNTKAIIV